MQLKLTLLKANKLGISLAVMGALVLAGCGGGGGGVAFTYNTTVISGMASKGPLNGSTVCAYKITAGAKGAAIGNCATNIINGIYSIDLGSYTGPVLLEATGGTYIDEATGASATLTLPLRSVINNVTGSSSVAVTALTEIVYQQASAAAGGLTATNVQSEVTKVQTTFSVSDIVNTLPIDPLNVPGNATPDQKAYALALATIAQYQNSLPTATLSVALQNINSCLSAPSTGCGTGSGSVGSGLNAGYYAFQTSQPAFQGLPPPPLASFGSVTTGTPELTVTQPTLSFITQTPGTSSAAQTVTVTNTGAAALTDLAVTWYTPSDFTTTTTCTRNLAIGASCTITVTFNPTMYSLAGGSLSRTGLVGIATSQNASTNFNLGLSGTVPPVPQPSISITQGSLSITSLSFGSQNYLTNSAAQTVTLTNTGTAPLDIFCIETLNSGATSSCKIAQPITPQNYSQTNTCVLTNMAYPLTPATVPANFGALANLAAGASCTVSVTFTPQASGSIAGVLSIVTDAANTPNFVLPLNGNGISATTTGPTITSFSPTSGAVGTPVILRGGNFSTTLTSNAVSFNGTPATVTAATATSLTVTVPSGATTGTISVTTAGGGVTSASSFTISATVSPTATTITSILPSSGTVGAIVTIKGTNFDPIPANNVVTFNGFAATVAYSTATLITVTVPGGATSGIVSVTSPSGIASTTGIYQVTVPALITPVAGLMGGSIQNAVPNISPALSVLSGGGVGLTLYGATLPVGVIGGSGKVNGIGTASAFQNPGAITTDGTNLYVADVNNNLIRKIVIATGQVSFLAGDNTNILGISSIDGIGSSAVLGTIMSMTTDGTNLFFTEASTIRKVVISTGEVTTIAGNRYVPSGYADGIGAEALFLAPYGITTDGTNLYVDDGGLRIRKVVIATGQVTTLAGSGTIGTLDGVGAAAQFRGWGWGDALTTDGTNLYVANGGLIRKVVIGTGQVTTIAGGGATNLDMFAGIGGAVGTSYRFGSLMDISTDGTNLYLISSSEVIKFVISSGITTRLVTTTQFSAPPAGFTSWLKNPLDWNIIAAGSSLFVTDNANSVINKIQ